ncbi:MAG: BatD family protein, partial [Candidatus Omnitrophica bacterium]|nr:BatD family protein [Candidatus Omnitrophota bacterium]
MKNRYLYIGSILFITLVVCNSWLYADEEALIQAQASIDKETISIGDTVTYTIVVKTKKNIDISFPTFGENFAGFAVKDFGSREEIFFGKKTIKKWYLLDTYVAGSYTIPPAIIKYHILSEEEVPQEEVLWSEIETNEVNVEVESVLLKADNDRDR